ncbi:uncharacterized protein [Diabrotica undecimpunctata]|uniref:uncharacterized protein n=1 Tax=Diabrotica undecimpunctata TaxID=50387 RepID=UPI003B64094F
MKECKPKKTPMEKGFQYIEDSEILTNIPYRQLIGGLMYLSTTSRPDISYLVHQTVSYLSRFLDSPTTETWNVGKRILRYLQGSKKLGLTYYKNTDCQITLNGYSDADWATDKKDRKSVSGCILIYANNPISWFSKKQNCVALSTAEAEYIAAAQTAQDLINVKGILGNFNVIVKKILYCDNKSTILMSNSNENSKRAKHIDIKNYFLKDLISKKEVLMDYISTEQNLADILTKFLGTETFINLRNKIYVI